MRPTCHPVPSGVGPQAPTRWTLPVILTGTFLVTLEFFIINVAAPAIQLDLHVSSSVIVAVVAGYGLSYASGLMFAARLGDRYGYRRTFLLGMVVFLLTSIGCACAPSGAWLIAARLAQGCAAAVLAPQVLTLITQLFSETRRGRAFVAYGAVLGGAAVFGQLVGGLLIAAGAGWRGCFLINVPFGLLAVLMTRRAVPDASTGAPMSKPPRLDVLGALLLTVGLAAAIGPLVVGRGLGWPRWLWVSAIGAVVLCGAFVLRQQILHRRGGIPLVDPRVFTTAFRRAVVAVVVFYAGIAAYFLVLALYLQQGLGLTALQAGTVFAVPGVAFLATSTMTWPKGALGARLLPVGSLITAVGLGLLGAAAALDRPAAAWTLLPGLFVNGAGLGLVMAPLVARATTAAPAEHVSTASGVVMTATQAGNALGVAVVGLIFYQTLGTQLTPGGYTTAFLAAIAYLIVLAGIVAVLTHRLDRTTTTARP